MVCNSLQNPKVEGSSPAAGPRRKTIAIKRLEKHDANSWPLASSSLKVLVVPLTWEVKNDKRKKLET